MLLRFARKLNTLQQLARHYSPGRLFRKKRLHFAQRSQEAFVATFPTGCKLWVEPHMFISKMYLIGYYEPYTVRFLQKTIKPGMVCIDIGANVGYFSLLMAKLTRPEGRVIAFEPTAQTAALLERNRALNSFSHIEIVRAAVSNKNSTLRFNVGEPGCEVYNTAGNVVHNSANPAAFIQVTVPCLTLDSYLQTKRIEHVDLIKLDIEGSEFAALQGMEQTLTENPAATLLIEFSDLTSGSLGYRASEMQEWLTKREWKLRVIGPFAMLKAPTPNETWNGQMVAARKQWKD